MNETKYIQESLPLPEIEYLEQSITIDNTSPKWEFLLILIPSGERNAVSMRYLASILTVDEREIRRMIESARRDGLIIATCEDGYFIPETMSELLRYRNTHMKRINSSIRALSHAFEITGDQMEFWRSKHDKDN